MNPEEELEFHILEERLRQLSPSDPGVGLTERVFAAFDTPADAAPAALDTITAMPKSASWFQPFAAAAAVAIIAGGVAIVGLNRPDSATDNQYDPAATTNTADSGADPISVVHQFVPDRAQNTFDGSTVDRIVFTEDRRPIQAVRYQFTDTYVWRDPANGLLVEIRVPVERVRYIQVPTD